MHLFFFFIVQFSFFTYNKINKMNSFVVLIVRNVKTLAVFQSQWTTLKTKKEYWFKIYENYV